jgi:hypothetical protein
MGRRGQRPKTQEREILDELWATARLKASNRTALHMSAPVLLRGPGLDEYEDSRIFQRLVQLVLQAPGFL